MGDSCAMRPTDRTLCTRSCDYLPNKFPLNAAYDSATAVGVR